MSIYKVTGSTLSSCFVWCRVWILWEAAGGGDSQLGWRAKTRQRDIQKCDTQALFATHRMLRNASWYRDDEHGLWSQLDLGSGGSSKASSKLYPLSEPQLPHLHNEVGRSPSKVIFGTPGDYASAGFSTVPTTHNKCSKVVALFGECSHWLPASSFSLTPHWVKGAMSFLTGSEACCFWNSLQTLLPFPFCEQK